MRPAFITRVGAKRDHTPEPEQLKGTGLKVADEQPHIPNGSESRFKDPWKDDEACTASLDADHGRQSAEPNGSSRLKPRKPRVARAKSATKPDGTIPTTLGGKLPPASVLARREFGLRALRK
jgi:hypothetical protein